MKGEHVVNKEEILQRNKKSNIDQEDEMEQYISGKAGTNAKFVFSIIILILAIFKYYKHMPTGDIWTIFMAYGATESFYKYYHLKYNKLLLAGILFSIASICSLCQFLILTW